MWLEATNLRLNYPSRKLAPKRQGPFEIAQVLSPLTYRLCLPSTWKIHDIFQTSLLSSYKETETHGPNFSKPPPDLISTEEEYEVEQIVSHQGSLGHQKYLTMWKGYPSLENTWEPKSNLKHASKILGDYKWAHSLSYLTTVPCPSSSNTTTPSPSTVTRVNRLTSWSRIGTYSEGGTHEETLHPQSKARVMNKRQGS